MSDKQEETQGATDAGDNKVDNKVDNENDNENEETQGQETAEESILQDPFLNQVSVARNHQLQYYVDRARRILRHSETVMVKGRQNTTSMACTLTEVLRRQKIAKITKISTGMETNAFFVGGNARWSKPASVILFELGRGELAEYVSDYQQRKVIDIFECQPGLVDGLLNYVTDDNNSIVVNVKGSKSTKTLANVFKSDDTLKAKASKFLTDLNKDEINLPEFIKYCSALIHPLLKDRIFKSMIQDELNIDAALNKDDSDANVDEQEYNGDDNQQADGVDGDATNVDAADADDADDDADVEEVN